MVQNHFCVKSQTPVYAKMQNTATLGLLKVIGAPVKSLLYVYFKNYRAKIHILTSIRKKVLSLIHKGSFKKYVTQKIDIFAPSSHVPLFHLWSWAPSPLSYPRKWHTLSWKWIKIRCELWVSICWNLYFDLYFKKVPCEHWYFPSLNSHSHERNRCRRCPFERSDSDQKEEISLALACCILIARG